MGFWRTFFFGLILLTLAAPCRADDMLSVEGVRYGGGAGKTRIVIDFNAKPDFRAFLLDGPKRLAVDLPPVSWRVPGAAMTGHGLVKGYRSGELEKDGLTRVIFDLKGPAEVVGAFALPRTGTAKDRLVIDLRPVSQNMFAAKTAEVYGNATLKGTGSLKSPSSGVGQDRDRQMAQINPPQKNMPSVIPEKILRTIVIDAGHGGQDPGAQGGPYREKDITLAIARELGRQLDETGRYRVVFTRNSDYYIKLHERVDISRREKGDLFVSIHADKIDRKGVSGASVYTLSETASDAETARLADDENNAGVVAGVDLKEESQDVADILLDLAMREKMNESNVLAKGVVEAFRRKSVRLLPNSHRSAGFAVLKAPDVPAILIETGFISNPDEAKLLSSGPFQRKIAGAMVDGIDAYFRKMQVLQKAR